VIEILNVQFFGCIEGAAARYGSPLQIRRKSEEIAVGYAIQFGNGMNNFFPLVILKITSQQFRTGS